MASQLIDHDLRCPAKKQEKAPECLNQDGRGETTFLQNNSGNFGSLGNDRNYKAFEVPGILYTVLQIQNNISLVIYILGLGRMKFHPMLPKNVRSSNW